MSLMRSFPACAARRTSPVNHVLRTLPSLISNFPKESLNTRTFTSTSSKMVQKLQASEVNSQTDPSVAKQYDNETPTDKQFEELYKIVDGLKIGLLTTQRPEIGPVSRSMAISKRAGPDLLFMANIHSQKFKDIENEQICQVTFQDSKSQDWVSITGKATAANSKDSRIKDLYNKSIKAWFGDLGDGVHDGGPDDPRMALIEVQARHIAYWKASVGSLGFMKEVAGAVATGGVADTGALRELKEADIEKARSLASA